MELNIKHRASKILAGMLALLATTTIAVSQPASDPASDPILERNCLGCHREQRLPDTLIYRRYLLKYSSTNRIEKALANYLKHPSQSTSIMPAEFFLRFPMREPTQMDDATLHENIRRYLNYFDVRKRLRLEE